VKTGGTPWRAVDPARRGALVVLDNAGADVHLAEDAELAAGILQPVHERRLKALRRRQLGAARLVVVLEPKRVVSTSGSTSGGTSCSTSSSIAIVTLRQLGSRAPPAPGAAARPWSLFHVRVLSIWRPANMVERLGTHCGDAAYVLTKFVPMAASLRRFGICMRELTGDVGSSTRPSIESHMRNRMFGFAVLELEPLLELDCGMACATEASSASESTRIVELSRLPVFAVIMTTTCPLCAVGHHPVT